MADGIYSAASGAVARMEQLDVIANNLANASSTGFRAQGVAFEDVLSGAGQAELRQAQVDGTFVSNIQGALVDTGRDLDAAIEGAGFFTLQGPQGALLTRNGHFTIDPSGTLVNEQGLAVLGQGGPIKVSANAPLTISDNGELVQDGNVIGALLISHYAAKDLRPAGGSALETVADAKASQAGPTERVRGKTLEQSNTSVLTQMTQMMTTNRLFDATMNAIDTYKQIDGKTASGLSRR